MFHVEYNGLLCAKDLAPVIFNLYIHMVYEWVGCTFQMGYVQVPHSSFLSYIYKIISKIYKRAEIVTPRFIIFYLPISRANYIID